MAGRNYNGRHLELLDGIETIILREGFRHLRIESLAKRLRCSRRTLYELAESKDEIVLLVLGRLLRRVERKALEAAQLEQDHVDKIRAYMTKGLAELHRATLSFSEDLAADPMAHDFVASHFRFGAGVVASMLAEGMEAGVFAHIHPRVAAEVLDAGIARLQDPSVLRQAGINFADAVEEFLTVFTDGIRSRNQRRGRRQRTT
jgi:AcrR family transcriptional regulator